MATNKTLLLLLCGGLVASFGSSCGDSAEDGTAGNASGANNAGGNNAAGNGSGASASGGGVNAGGGAPPPTEITECQGHVYECGDLVDNDMDELTDYQDPDCLGPCDDTEDSYYGGIPGQMGPPCSVDCYFDQDSGAGNDDCYWDHRCDANEVARDFYPEPDNGSQCEFQGDDYVVGQGQTCADLDDAQSDECYAYCGPLTPNGCDCFGCCELPAGSGAFVWLGSVGVDGTTVCDLANVSNPAICHPCQVVTSCFNDCDPCEICIGQPEPGPECGEGGGGPGGGGQGGGGQGSQCPTDIQECGLPGQEPCPAGYACITGCCYPVPE
jgi:hypothetical protein